jgi:hypothetical protein
MVHVRAQAGLGEHLPGGVGDGDADVSVPEIDADHVAGRPGRREQRGRAAALARMAASRLALGDQAVGEQRRDRVGHRAARQPGQPAQVGAGDAAKVADRLQQLRRCPLMPRQGRRPGDHDGHPRAISSVYRINFLFISMPGEAA